MSAATRLARLFDRRFVAGLAVLAGVCVVVALLWGAQRRRDGRRHAIGCLWTGRQL